MAVQRTLAQLKTEVASFIDDASYTRWSEADVTAAIYAAMRNAPPAWWEDRIDDTHTYSDSTYRYALPPVCETVEEVWFEPLSSDKPRRLVVPSSWHIEGDELVFTETYSKYDGQTLYMHYVVFPQHVLSISNTDGEVSAGTGLNVFSSDDSTFITDGVLPGDALVLTQGTFYVKEVLEETALEVHKDMAEGSTLPFSVAYYTDVPIMYLLYFATAELYERASRNRPGVEVDENLRFSAYYRQLAAQELRRQRKTHRPRRRY